MNGDQRGRGAVSTEPVTLHPVKHNALTPFPSKSERVEEASSTRILCASCRSASQLNKIGRSSYLRLSRNHLVLLLATLSRTEAGL